MKSELKYIAVLDKKNKIHSVSFKSGINVITGKSSTGKSAMIEIFDYCFGSSEYTVPQGIITDSAELYFIVLAIKSTHLILARNPKQKNLFLKEVSILPEINSFNKDFFNNDYFIPLSDFKVELGRHFGLIIEDTDIDLEDRKYRRNNAKSPRPTVRNFTSFMLQHQNLVANKHSIFYRFDESRKREQTIDNFKIFTSFVSQDYFIKKQKLNEFERELKNLQNKQDIIKELRQEKERSLADLLNEYVAVTGKYLFKSSNNSILNQPSKYLEEIKYLNVSLDITSDEISNQLKDLKNNFNIALSEKRELQFKLNDIRSSIIYAENYKEDTLNTVVLSETSIHLSECPFCKTKHEDLVSEANSLEKAINWLNSELSKTPYLLSSFLSEQKAVETLIQSKNLELINLTDKILKLENTVKELSKNKSIEEQGLKIKLKIESILEEKINYNISEYENNIEKIKIKISSLENEIKVKYNPEQKIRVAEKYINNAMNEIGNKLDFESSYNPINLKFSLENFDLWHEKPDGSKVFLRSMGSGANWLYCHLALFTALHKYFCSLSNNCLIPTILFFDQPSQVYFPTSIIDNKEEFDAKELKEKEGKSNTVDEDLQAVTNLYNQLVNFSKKTFEETGIEPQIIISDHADNLKLDSVEFDDLVGDRRWRKRGFIS